MSSLEKCVSWATVCNVNILFRKLNKYLKYSFTVLLRDYSTIQVQYNTIQYKFYKINNTHANYQTCVPNIMKFIVLSKK